MTYTVKINDMLKEKIFVNTLSSGAKCYIIPKKRFEQAQAAAVFGFGSENMLFSVSGEGKSVPAGTAHFLEHKMFESEKGDLMELFRKNGADANAFTDYKKTAYTFTCGKKDFYKNLKIMLESIFSPAFDEKSVEAEKSIIKSEIAMYEDSPQRKAFVKLMECLYENYPLKFDVAGDAASVDSVTKNDLLAAFDAFYMPSNMSIICVGDVECRRIVDMAEMLINSCESPLGEKLFHGEKEEVVKNFIQCKMGVEKPLFNIGFKEKNTGKYMNVKKFYGMKILLETILGKGSSFFERLYKKDVLTEPLEFQYLTGHDFSTVIIGGKANDPALVKDEILAEIKARLLGGINEEPFKRVMKMEKGRFIRGFDYPDSAFMSQIELSVMGSDLIEAFDEVMSVDKEYIEKLLKEVLKEDKMALSVVK